MPTAPSGSSRCVVLLGVAAPMLVRPIVDHLTDAHLEHATVLEVLCRPEDAKSRHSVLRRLFDRPEPARVRVAAAAIAACSAARSASDAFAGFRCTIAR